MIRDFNLDLCIGGIELSIVSCDPKLRFRVDGDAKKFLSQDQKGERIFVARFEDLSGEKPKGLKVYDSGEIWRLYEGDGFTFWFTSTRFGAVPYKVARISKDFTSGEILFDYSCYDFREPVYPLEYPLDELLVANILSLRRGAIVHGCGVVDVRGRGLLFVGHSGAGKSTMARLWKGIGGATILSDDRIILREIDDTIWIYGTPWHGDEGSALPFRAPLEAVYFLRHSKHNKLIPRRFVESAVDLVSCSVTPYYYREGTESILRFYENLTGRIPCHELYFRPGKSAVEFVESCLSTP